MSLSSAQTFPPMNIIFLLVILFVPTHSAVVEQSDLEGQIDSGRPDHQISQTITNTDGSPRPSESSIERQRVQSQPSSSQEATITIPPGQEENSSPSQPVTSSAGGGGEMPTRDDGGNSLKLGKTFLGLTFQAALALMIFRYRAPQNSSASPPPPPPPPTNSVSLDVVGASMVSGFTLTSIGMVLRSKTPYSTAASISEYGGMFSVALGFFLMMEMFVSEPFRWTVWAAAAILVLAFAYALSGSSQ